MQKLSPSHKTGVTQAALRFTALRLKSRPETQALCPAFDAVRADLAQKQAAYEDAVDARMVLTAELEYRDHALDARVMRLSRELLGQEERRDTGRFLRFFPAPPSELLKPEGGALQHRAVRLILHALDEEGAAGVQELQHHAGPLRELQAALEQAEAQREALYVQESRAKAERDLALREAQQHYNLLYPQLMLLFPKDGALVESFFRKLQASTRAEQDDEPSDDLG